MVMWTKANSYILYHVKKELVEIQISAERMMSQIIIHINVSNLWGK